MASVTSKLPSQVRVKDCPACLHHPQVFRATDGANDKWCIVCPECGFSLVGARVEGLGLDCQNIIPVAKPGDDLQAMIQKWNAMEAPPGVQGAA